MDRRTFITSASAAAALSHGQAALAAPAAQGDVALKAALDTQFEDDILNSPENATSLGLDKGKLAAQSPSQL